jgi:ParB/RepB/Spo0J family partition protein
VSRQLKDVAISDIEIPKSRDRSIDWNREEHARFLNSIRRDGLQQPILLQPPKEDGDGKHRLVFGVERFKAGKHLGWKTIRAEIDEGMTDEEAERAMLAENLFRTGQKEDMAYRKALRRWFESHEARQDGKNDKALVAAEKPRRGGQFVAKSEPTQTAQISPTTSAIVALVVSDDEEDMESEPEASDTASHPAQFAKEKPFAKQIQEVTGCSRRESFRDAAVARAFTTEQLEILEQGGWGQEKYLKMIAELDQPDDIRGAIQLIAFGINPEEAVADVRKIVAERSENDGEDPHKMSDARWLEAECLACRSRLSNTAAFDQAALTYRKVRGALNIFKHHIRAAVKSNIRGKRYDPFTIMLHRMISVKHPDEWAVCAICNGSGQHPEQPDKWCEKCHGAGFFVEYEREK